MNITIASLLLQDGITSGAIYAILALALIIVFSVTRILFLPQGELVSLSALTLAALNAGHMPGTVWLLAIGAACAAAVDGWRCLRRSDDFGHLRGPLVYVLIAMIAVAISQINPNGLPWWASIGLTFAIIAPLAPITYRLAFEPIANSSILTLLIAAVAAHFVLGGLGLFLFGPEGVRAPPIIQSDLRLFGANLQGEALFVVGVTVMASIALMVMFRHTTYGKVLLATAFNRVGSKLVGIKPERAGMMAFILAGVVGAASGILASSLTTVYYDTGFTFGLKGFIAAIVGGLVSYPLAFAGGLIIGVLEAFSSFWFSEFKDVIVFALVLPILIWKSMSALGLIEQHDE